MAKKGKKGKKGKGKDAATKLEELRLAGLRALETEAEELQQHENERREREEQDERISHIREEQLRLIREKEKRIDELNGKVTEISFTLRDDRLSYASQIEQLSVLRDSLLNEVSLLKAENEERMQIFTQERQNNIIQTEKLRSDIDLMKATFEQEKSQLREQLHLTNTELEEERKKLDEVTEEKDNHEREHLIQIKALERELEKAIIINKSLQEAVENREADDKKNVTLMQLLNAQLDESKRHFEEQLEDERQHTNRTKEEVLRLETKCSHLQEELDIIKSASFEEKHQADVEMREYQRQLEQVKYDSEYLNNEIESMRAQFSKAMRESETAKNDAETNAQNYLIEIEVLQRKTEDMEALLYKKEREHFDKTTFLNAQISNNRTVVTQLQQKLNSERQAHESELERRTVDVRQTLEELNQLNEVEVQRSQERKANEDMLLTDISILKTTVFQLQAGLEEKEKSFETVRLSKDAEIQRLHDILDAHFIPHRKDVEHARASGKVDEVSLLRDKLEEQNREMTMKQQAAMETEVWLKARITNQAETIEALQRDLKNVELLRREEVRCLEDEISRLKKTLEIHFIPCSV